MEHNWRATLGAAMAHAAPAGAASARAAVRDLRTAAGTYRLCAGQPGATMRLELVVFGSAPFQLDAGVLVDGLLEDGFLAYAPELPAWKSALATAADRVADTLEAAYDRPGSVQEAELRHADVARALLTHVYFTGTGRAHDLQRGGSVMTLHVDDAVARVCALRLSGSQDEPAAAGVGAVCGVTLPATTLAALEANTGSFGAASVAHMAVTNLIDRHTVRVAHHRAERAASKLYANLGTAEGLAAVALGGPPEVAAQVAAHVASPEVSRSGSALARYKAAALAVSACGAALAQLGGGIVYANLRVTAGPDSAAYPAVAEAGRGNIKLPVTLRWGVGQTTLPLRPSAVCVKNGRVMMDPVEPDVAAPGAKAGDLLAAGLLGVPRTICGPWVLPSLMSNAFEVAHVYAREWKGLARLVLRQCQLVCGYGHITTDDELHNGRSGLPFLLERLMAEGEEGAVEALAEYLEVAQLSVLPLPTEHFLFSQAQVRHRLHKQPYLSDLAKAFAVAVLRDINLAQKVPKQKRKLVVAHLGKPPKAGRQHALRLRQVDSFHSTDALLQLRLGPRRTWPADAQRGAGLVTDVDVAAFHPLTSTVGAVDRATQRFAVVVIPPVKSPFGWGKLLQ